MTSCRQPQDNTAFQKKKADLLEPMRPKKCYNKKANGGSEDDGECCGMQQLFSPVLILRKIGTTFQVGVDQREREGSQGSLDGGLHFLRFVSLFLL